MAVLLAESLVVYLVDLLDDYWADVMVASWVVQKDTVMAAMLVVSKVVMSVDCSVGSLVASLADDLVDLLAVKMVVVMV